LCRALSTAPVCGAEMLEQRSSVLAIPNAKTGERCPAVLMNAVN
jgi:hypothetical protein